MNKIAPDDPRADHPTYVAVCRTCGGWQYLGDAEAADMEAENKQAAVHAVEHNCDFMKMRFGDVNLTMCECLRANRQASKQEAVPA